MAFSQDINLYLTPTIPSFSEVKHLLNLFER